MTAPLPPAETLQAPLYEEVKPGRIYPETVVIACIFAASLIVGVCGVVRGLVETQGRMKP